jgi:hypothetical protein
LGLKQETENGDSLDFCTEDSRLKVGKKSEDFLRTGWICLANYYIGGEVKGASHVCRPHPKSLCQSGRGNSIRLTLSSKGRRAWEMRESKSLLGLIVGKWR